jgi:hypothetical protein
MSVQEKAQAHLSQLDKEVCLPHLHFDPPSMPARAVFLTMLAVSIPLYPCVLSIRAFTLTSLCSLAVKIPRPQQLREADVGAQSLRHSWSRRPVLLPCLLQHRWRFSCEHCWFHDSQLLFVERSIQREQG